MTIQVRDEYTHQGENYVFLASPCFEGFNPYLYGFVPTPANTAFIDGYWCSYSIKDNYLYFDTLHIHCNDDNYPKLFSRNYSKNILGQPIERMGYRTYKSLNMRAHISGSILLGKDMIAQPLEDDFHALFNYNTVKEFIFKDDKLIHIIDWSPTVKEMKKNRNNQAKIQEYKSKYWWC